MQAIVSKSNRVIDILLIPRTNSSESARTEQDIASIRFSYLDASILCKVHLDIGLPIPQGLNIGITCPDNFVSILRDKEEYADFGESFCTSLAYAALSVAANRALVSSQPKNIPGASIAIDSFQALFSDRGQQFATLESDLAGLSSNDLKLPEDLAEFALQQGILKENDASLVPVDEFCINVQSPRSAITVLREMRRISNQHGFQFSPGMDNIDLPAASRALGAVQCPSTAAVCFYGDTTCPHHAYRCQAANSYKLFADYILEFEEVRKAIDVGAALRPLVANVTGLTGNKLKRLGRLTCTGDSSPSKESVPANETNPRDQDFYGTQFESLEGATIQSIAYSLKNLDSSWIPVDSGEWKCFLDNLTNCALPLERRLKIPVATTMRTSKGQWQAFKAGLAMGAQVPLVAFGPRQTHLATIEAIDAVTDFTRAVLLPAVLSTIVRTEGPLPLPTGQDLETAERVSTTLLCGNSRNVARTLIDLGRRWQNRSLALYDAEFRGSDREKKLDLRFFRTQSSWPALAEDFQAKGDLVIRNLNSIDELREESRRLGHCVGRLYVSPAKKGKCHIFSIQDASGARSYSTFEVLPPRSDIDNVARSQITLVQHKSLNNRAPGKRLELVLRDWFQALKSGQIQLNLQDVREWKRNIDIVTRDESRVSSGLVSPQEAWGRLLGENWNDADTRTSIFNEWKSNILTRSISKGLNQKALLVASPVRALVRGFHLPPQP